jgi:ring-1,2-phenylacetyl-CoA epoxidase subunit PaaE
MSLHFHKLKVKDIRTETNDCVSIAFEIPDELKNTFGFIQGQNLTLRIWDNGSEIRRNYSICSAPSDNELRIAVKLVNQGKFSTFANRQLKPGDTLEVLPPTGKFYTPLDPSQKKNYLAIAAGSGITPVISIIKTTLQTEPDSSFTLIYGNKTRASIIFKEELEDLKNKYISRFSIIHVLSREISDVPLFSGRIDALKCQDLFTKLADIKTMDEVFLCGPEEMIFSVAGYLSDVGMATKNIHYELFTTPGISHGISTGKVLVEAIDDEKKSMVSLQIDGVATTFNLRYNGESILSAALKLGIDLPFACKGGVCSTCRAKLLEGQVEMDNNYALEEDELEKGFILTCQSHPRSEKLVITFDER